MDGYPTSGITKRPRLPALPHALEPLPEGSAPSATNVAVAEPADLFPSGADFVPQRPAVAAPALERKPIPKPDKKAAGKPKRSSGGLGSLLRPVGGLLFLVAIAAALFFGRGLVSPTTSVSELEAGQCIENFFERNEDGSFIEIFSLSVVDCGEPHAYEVFAVSDSLFPDDVYPGVAESFTAGEAFCLEQYEPFIGGDLANLSTWEVWTFVPPENSWSDDRTVQCVVGDAAHTELFTGSLSGAASE